MFKKIHYFFQTIKKEDLKPVFLRLSKYVFSGFLGAGTNIFILYLLTDKFGLWYLLSGIISFVCSVFVSFVLHKELTFNDKVRHKINKKFILFFLVATINLLINTTMLYLLTDVFGIFYLLSQVVASVLIATWSYFLYHWLVFDVDCA
ncbi:MAG: GtrA family protein [Candidatus Paceibacterota bacterium]|jgi:dolichol-phosphate mannosyltransferase